jgi:hypothetical protein
MIKPGCLFSDLHRPVFLLVKQVNAGWVLQGSSKRHQDNQEAVQQWKEEPDASK